MLPQVPLHFAEVGVAVPHRVWFGAESNGATLSPAMLSTDLLLSTTTLAPDCRSLSVSHSHVTGPDHVSFLRQGLTRRPCS